MRDVTEADRAIGQRIRSARVDRKISMKTISKIINVTVQQMQKYERGDNRISASRVANISEYLNIPVTDLLGLEGSRQGGYDLSRQAMQLAAAFDRLPDTGIKDNLYALVVRMAGEDGFRLD